MTKTEIINLKAKGLVERFLDCEAKECALACIDEQLKTLSNIDTSFNDDIAEEVYQQELELEKIKEQIKKM